MAAGSTIRTQGKAMATTRSSLEGLATRLPDRNLLVLLYRTNYTFLTIHNGINIGILRHRVYYCCVYFSCGAPRATHSTIMTHSSPTTRSLLVGASANLFISAAGAGLLSYPYAVLQQGIAINALLTVVFAFLNAYTDLILAASAFRIRRQLRVFTYEETCLQILGPWGYGVAVFTVIVGCAGSSEPAPWLNTACSHVLSFFTPIQQLLGS